MIVQGGPGETQPGGVVPGVSQRLAWPVVEFMPGENMLLLKDADSVMLSVMSEIRTIHGEVHGTCGFHDPVPTPCGGVIVLADTGEIIQLRNIGEAITVRMRNPTEKNRRFLIRICIGLPVIRPIKPEQDLVLQNV